MMAMVSSSEFLWGALVFGVVIFALAIYPSDAWNTTAGYEDDDGPW